jgi:hypothetical protein
LWRRPRPKLGCGAKGRRRRRRRRRKDGEPTPKSISIGYGLIEWAHRYKFQHHTRTCALNAQRKEDKDEQRGSER